ncbi:MAG: hypothetical protein ACXVZX_10365 [Terriglobales bacterium]
METEVTIELKYCERCGGLWLRRVGSTEAYCVTCAPEMRLVAQPHKKAAASERWDRTMQDLGGVACA